MILEEGKIYNNSQLAEWFQVKPATFTKSKQKKLEYLKNFAEFEEIKCKVKITKVLEPNYINPRDKESNNKAYQHDIVEVIQEEPLQMFKTCTGRITLLKNSQTGHYYYTICPDLSFFLVQILKFIIKYLILSNKVCTFAVLQ